MKLYSIGGRLILGVVLLIGLSMLFERDDRPADPAAREARMMSLRLGQAVVGLEEASTALSFGEFSVSLETMTEACADLRAAALYAPEPDARALRTASDHCRTARSALRRGDRDGVTVAMGAMTNALEGREK